MPTTEPVDPPVGAVTGARPRGRPRSVEADRAITSAALEVLADDGVGAFCVEAVAARAGVSKATIYRRFANRESLLAESLASLNAELPPIPDTGSVRGDLVALLSTWRNRHVHSQAGRIMPRMISAAHAHPELFALYDERVFEPRRERFRTVLRRGVARGEVRAGLDLDLALILLVGPMMMWTTARSRGSEPITDASIEALVDLVLTGVAPR